MIHGDGNVPRGVWTCGSLKLEKKNDRHRCQGEKTSSSAFPKTINHSRLDHFHSK